MTSRIDSERARAPKMLKAAGYAMGGAVKADQPIMDRATPKPVKKAYGGPMPMPAPQMAPPGAPAMRPNLGRPMRPGMMADAPSDMGMKRGGKVKC